MEIKENKIRKQYMMMVNKKLLYSKVSQIK